MNFAKTTSAHVFKEQRGFSLIELLVALVIASVCSLAIYSVFTISSRSYTTQGVTADVQQSVRAAMEVMLQDIVEILPRSWEHSEVACARIVLDGMEFKTENHTDTRWKQMAELRVRGEPVGVIEVGYLANKPVRAEGPFLAEERSLIETVAREIAGFLERRAAGRDRELLQDQLRHADRLATIGQLAAGVAHELNEPLGNILGFAQLVQLAPERIEQVEKDAGQIVTACLHAREIIRKLLVFARQLPPKKDSVNLNERYVVY